MAAWPYCTSQWQRLRLAKLAASPVCVICELRGETTEANTVDHVKAIRQGGEPFPDLDGLMSLCEPCHNEKTANVDRTASVTGRRFRGCDASGNPVDPADGWWNGQSSLPIVEVGVPAITRIEPTGDRVWRKEHT